MNSHGRPHLWVKIVTGFAATAVAGALIVGGTFAFNTFKDSTPDTSSGTAPADTETPAPTAPVGEPQLAAAHAAFGPIPPTDCRAIYPDGYPIGYKDDVLNAPEMMTSDISRYRAIEQIRESLPGIECHWGYGTEGGVMNAVNTVDAGTQTKLVTVMEANDHVCGPHLGGTLCRQSETHPEDTDGTAWTTAEDHYFRNGIWVSTWWAGTASSINFYTDGIYATIWAPPVSAPEPDTEPE